MQNTVSQKVTGTGRTLNERARTTGTKIVAGIALAFFLIFGESAWKGVSPVVEETLMFFACFCAGIGALGRVWCSLYLEGRKNSVLVREGPYALCRNPLYFFSFVGAAGTTLATETFTVPAIVCSLFALYYPTIVAAEQKRLELIFGEDYRAYKRDVPTVFPKLFARAKQSESYTVNPRRFLSRVADAAWFIWLIGLFEFSAGLHEAGILPMLFRLYQNFHYKFSRVMKKFFDCYYVQRILPFFVVLFGLEAVEVAATFFWDFSKVDTTPFPLAHAALNVVLETTTAFLYWLIPFLAFLFFLPRKMHGGKTDKTVSLIYFSVLTIVCVFTETAELFFWEEFRSRFNFIAVDYLVYTNEVVGNIWQSYPMVPILAGILCVAAVVGILVWKKFQTPPDVPAAKTRGAVLAGAVALCVAAFFGLDISNAEGTGNRYNDELGKNGFYSLFSAFLKNELPYEEFYPTLPSDVVTEKLRREFSQRETHFLNPAGTRSVRGLEAVSTAIPPLPGMSVVRRNGNENIETAGKIFSDRGYKTRWIYGGYGIFDNMNYFFGNNSAPAPTDDAVAYYQHTENWREFLRPQRIPAKAENP